MESTQSLFIVSNRLPVTAGKEPDGSWAVKMSSGGLVAGLKEIHSQASSYWVGHSGLFASDPQFDDLLTHLKERRLIPVKLDRKTYNKYYNGISNNAIWPLFHYFPAAMKFSLDDWEGYVEANKAFARSILNLAGPDDWVWVHDYQLMLLPKMLREARPALKVAYFHHIPFPSSEVFRSLPNRQMILEGLLGADYIGFHTYDYVRHFLSSVTRVLGNDIHVDEVNYGNRLVKVAAHPLGVDFSRIATIAENLTRKDSDGGKVATALRDTRYTFLGIDRLDYTKGVPERLLAFRAFLRAHPEYVGEATFIQLCVPSRAEIQTYGNLKSTVEGLVGQINGEFSRPGYTPIQYLYRSLPIEQVVELYKAADVALVTPLRDGLNLVCKEYVAARDDGDGVLILSEFAGAATEMGEALKANPYDVQALADAMYQALVMEPTERRRRMQLLRERVRVNDNLAWGNDFIEAWKVYNQNHSQPQSQRLKGPLRAEIIQRMAEAPRCFIFLDNDGTLTPIASRPELAIPSPKVLNLLRQTAEIPGLVVTLITGRPRDFCEQFFTSLPINVVAEHGSFIWERETGIWQGQIIAEEYEKLKPDLLKLLETYTRNVPGSHIEIKETSLVWHYRQAEPVFAEALAKELIQQLQHMLANTSLSVFLGKKVLEIRQVFANKGYAVEHFLARYGWQPDEALATVGDDTTDEDMHKVQSEHNLTIHVGRPNLYARYFLTSPEDLFNLLTELRDTLQAREV